jgi:transcription elongation factor Elf1
MEEVFKCPRCNKANIRFRIKLNNYVCNICGHSWEKNIEEKIDG